MQYIFANCVVRKAKSRMLEVTSRQITSRGFPFRAKTVPKLSGEKKTNKGNKDNLLNFFQVGATSETPRKARA